MLGVEAKVLVSGCRSTEIVVWLLKVIFQLDMPGLGGYLDLVWICHRTSLVPTDISQQREAPLTSHIRLTQMVMDMIWFGIWIWYLFYSIHISCW